MWQWPRWNLCANQNGKHASFGLCVVMSRLKNSRLINITISQTIEEVRAYLRVWACFPARCARTLVCNFDLIRRKPYPYYCLKNNSLWCTFPVWPDADMARYATHWLWQVGSVSSWPVAIYCETIFYLNLFFFLIRWMFGIHWNLEDWKQEKTFQYYQLSKMINLILILEF